MEQLKYVHIAITTLLLAGIVVLVNGIETALRQMAGIAQVNLAYGPQSTWAVSSAVNSGAGVMQWLLPIVVIMVIVVAIVGVMLRSYCKHNGATR